MAHSFRYWMAIESSLLHQNVKLKANKEVSKEILKDISMEAVRVKFFMQLDQKKQ